MSRCPTCKAASSASQDQIDWVLTSYIVAAAIMTPPTGFLAGRFGLKRLFLVSVAGFTVASMLCGMAQSLTQIVLFRVLQGAFGAALVPLSQTVLLEHLSAGAAGLRDGAVRRRRDGRSGARAGARRLADRELQLALRLLHQSADRHPRLLGIIAFLPETPRERRREAGLVRLRHLEPGDRRAAGHARPRRAELDWFGSGEIIIEAIVAASAFYLFLVHTFTAPRSRSCGRRCFATAISRLACSSSSIVGLTYYASLALQPPYLQELMNYPVVTAGLVMGPRGIGTMASMLVVGRLVGRVDTAHSARHRPRAHRLVVLCDDRLDAGRLAGDDHRRRRGPGRRARLPVRAAERGDVVDAAAASSGPKAPASTVCRAISVRASAFRW